MILVFGKTGQVARELALQAPDAIFLDRSEADLSQPDACRAAILETGPSVVINAAAYTAVDKAEDNEAEARLVNAAAPIAMAQACKELGIPLVHISTDYVFNGTGTNAFSPDLAADPINAYGRTKHEGEVNIRATDVCHGILRTSWVFSSYGNNFVKTMLRLGNERDELSIVADQIGGPTSARAIAAACLVMADALLVDPNKTGTYHFSGADDVSWADFAREIFVQAKQTVVVHDIPTSAYPTPAQRPLNSRLDCSSFEHKFGMSRPLWKAELALVLEKLETA